MGVRTELQDTLQQIVCTEKLFSQFKFPSTEQQNRILEFLHTADKELYQNFDPLKITIFIRTTGDNFRAAAKFPTEQTSFSILNMADLANNPYGQFITSLWRGAETRNMLKLHASTHYSELSHVVSNGVSLVVNDCSETFNIVAFLVADLSFIKDIIGQCASTSNYGCYHCIMPSKQWLHDSRSEAKPKVVTEMSTYGVKRLDTLGEDASHDTKEFKTFQPKHFGQWVWTILEIIMIIFIDNKNEHFVCGFKPSLCTIFLKGVSFISVEELNLLSV